LKGRKTRPTFFGGGLFFKKDKISLAKSQKTLKLGHRFRYINLDESTIRTSNLPLAGEWFFGQRPSHSLSPGQRPGKEV
jgi:hypothetical protein